MFRRSDNSLFHKQSGVGNVRKRRLLALRPCDYLVREEVSVHYKEDIISSVLGSRGQQRRPRLHGSSSRCGGTRGTHKFQPKDHRAEENQLKLSLYHLCWLLGTSVLRK